MPTCTITGTLENLDGTPCIDADIRVFLVPTDKDQGGQFVGNVGVTSDAIDAVTDETGLFSVDLLQGARVRIEVAVINLRKIFTVPSTSSANLSDLV